MRPYFQLLTVVVIEVCDLVTAVPVMLDSEASGAHSGGDIAVAVVAAEVDIALLALVLHLPVHRNVTVHTLPLLVLVRVVRVRLTSLLIGRYPVLQVLLGDDART